MRRPARTPSVILAALLPVVLPGCAQPQAHPDPQKPDQPTIGTSATTEQQRADHDRDPHHLQERFTDADRWARRFENPERDDWQKPDHVIDIIGLKPADRVADIGSATGYFPVRFARAVPDGFVYGLDVEQTMVDYLNARARDEGLDNLVSLHCPPDDAPLPEPVDVIFICNTYHHIHHRVRYFQKLRDRFRPGGRLVIVDYYKRRLPMGPPPEHKLARHRVIEELTEAGYRLQLSDDRLPYQYLLIFTPADITGG